MQQSPTAGMGIAFEDGSMYYTTWQPSTAVGTGTLVVSVLDAQNILGMGTAERIYTVNTAGRITPMCLSP